MKLLIQKIELRISGIEKRLWVIIALLLISLLFTKGGAFSGILTGFTTLEVTHTMEPIILFAFVAGLGSILRSYLGYLKVKGEVDFDWSMLFISFVPAVSAALGSTVLLNMTPSMANLVLIFFGSAGFNSLQDKFGLQKKH